MGPSPFRVGLFTTLILICIVSLVIGACGGPAGITSDSTSDDDDDETDITGDAELPSTINTQGLYPQPDEESFPTNAAIMVTLTEDAEASTVNTSTFYVDSFVTPSGSGLTALQATVLSGQVSYSAQDRTAIFKPDSNLSSNASYRVVISSGVKKAQSASSLSPNINQLAAMNPGTKNSTGESICPSDCRYSFQTGSGADTTGPMVSSVLPANGATDVSVSSPNICLDFDECLDVSTVTPSAAHLTDDSDDTVVSSLSYLYQYGTLSRICLTPSGSLQYDSIYTIHATSSLQDMAGNQAIGETFSFTTEAEEIEPVATAADETAPTVLSVTPAPVGTGIARNTTIRVTFSEAIDTDTLDSTAFYLEKVVAGQTSAVAGAITITTDTQGRTIATLTPTNQLAPLSTYRITVVDVDDEAGNTMAYTYWDSFTTGTTPDNESPDDPTALAGSATAETSIQLCWTASDDDVSDASDILYRICQTTVSGNCTGSNFTTTYSQSLSATAGQQVCHTIQGLTSYETYYFAVRADDEAANESSVSSELEVKTYRPFFNMAVLAGGFGGEGFVDASFTYARLDGTRSNTLLGSYLYSLDGYTIRKVNLSSGAVTTLAGKYDTSGSTDGTGSAARFNAYSGAIVTDGTDLFVSDTNNCTIRRVTTAGVVTTLAGSAGSCSTTDGIGGAARFYYPYRMDYASGYLFVADNSSCTIRRVKTSTGATVTLAGVSGACTTSDGYGTSTAKFNYPKDITYDSGTGRLFVLQNDCVIRRVTDGALSFTGSSDDDIASYRDTHIYVSTYYGTSWYCSATAGQLPSSDGLIATGGTLYIGTNYDYTVRSLAIQGTAPSNTTVLAGSSYTSGYTDGIGTAARFGSTLYDFSSDGTNLYVSGNGNSLIRKIVISSATVSTQAGLPPATGTTDDTGTAARFNTPYGITSDGTDFYVTDNQSCTIRKITSSDVVSTIAGSAGNCSLQDGTGTGARFNYPKGITYNSSDGYLYVVDSNSYTIRRVNPSSGAVTTIAGSGSSCSSGSTCDGTGTSAKFSSPRGITHVSGGTYGKLYVTQGSSNCTIREIDLDANYLVSTVAGMAGSCNSAWYSLYNPEGIVAAGNSLYVTTIGDHKVRKIDIGTSTISNLAGSGSSGSTDGTGGAASFYAPAGITYDSDNGYLYVFDTGNRLIRRVDPSSGEVKTVAGDSSYNGTLPNSGTDAIFYADPMYLSSSYNGIHYTGNTLYIPNDHNIKWMSAGTPEYP